MAGLTLHTRLRVKSDDSNTSEIVIDAVEWNPEKAAVIICDMWDTHFCISAAKRTDEMAPRVNKVIADVRKEGALIIHSPCGCMWPYANTPQRRRAEGAPHVDPPVKFGRSRWNGERESPTSGSMSFWPV